MARLRGGTRQGHKAVYGAPSAAFYFRACARACVRALVGCVLHHDDGESLRELGPDLGADLRGARDRGT